MHTFSTVLVVWLQPTDQRVVVPREQLGAHVQHGVCNVATAIDRSMAIQPKDQRVIVNRRRVVHTFSTVLVVWLQPTDQRVVLPRRGPVVAHDQHNVCSAAISYSVWLSPGDEWVHTISTVFVVWLQPTDQRVVVPRGRVGAHDQHSVCSVATAYRPACGYPQGTSGCTRSARCGCSPGTPCTTGSWPSRQRARDCRSPRGPGLTVTSRLV